MENRPRIKGHGVPVVDLATNREYYVANDRNGIPNAVMSVRRRVLGDVGNVISKDYKPTINILKVRIQLFMIFLFINF